MSKRKKETRDKHKKKKGKDQFGRLKSSIQALLDENVDRELSLKQIIRKIGLKKKEDLKKAGQFIDELVDKGKIKQLPNGTYVSNGVSQEYTGVVDHVSSRFAYVNIGEEQDVYVKTQDLKSAVNGDTVKVVIFPTRHGEHPEGKVTEIVKRNRSRFVGKIQVSPNYAFVVADFRKIHEDFFVYPENINNAKTGDKVIVEVTRWGEDDKKPEAKVVEVLGKA